MAASSPAVLPISNPQPTTTTTTNTNSVSSVESQPLIATPAFHTFIGHLSNSLHHGLSQRRPWSELLDRTAFAKPESFSDATLRIHKNYSYFRVNYLAVLAVVVAIVLVVSLLTNPISLLILVSLLSAWLFLYLFRPFDHPLVIFSRTFSNTQTLWDLIGLSVFVVFLTNVGSLLISALLVGFALVCVHGAFRVPGDLFLDDQENNPATGFLSFLSGAASNAAAVAAIALVVAARV